MSLSDNFQLPQDWQIGKSHSDSSLCLLRAGLHADVWFSCMDHDESDKADRIPAHKLILASRSPVFEAMFYGEMAESSSEIHLSQIEKIPFLLFLRCLYSDETDLSEEYAVDVMRIAHQYQVTTCVDLCSEFLQGIVRIDNACYLLETALLLHDTDLVKAATHFIDDNAPAVIQSEGFEDISLETLEYILKGNTFFAPEVDIIEAVDDWALSKLAKNDMTADSANKRLVMGNAFYYLRLPILSPRDFIAAQLTYEYLTNEEQKNTSRFILQKEAIDLCNSIEERRPRQATCFISVLQCSQKELIPNKTAKSMATLVCVKDIELEAIILLLKQDQSVDIIATCTIETSREKKVILNNTFSLESNHLILPDLPLQASESPYVITVSIVVESNTEESDDSRSPSPKAVYGLAFSRPPAVRGKIQKMSVSMQTEDDSVSGQRLETGAGLAGIVNGDFPTCFIHGIEYTNKSNR